MAYQSICSREQWLDPDYGAETPVGTCPRCNEDLFVGDYVYESVEDGEMICESCFEDEAREHRKEIEEPEPDYDSMPGGADNCDW